MSERLSEKRLRGIRSAINADTETAYVAASIDNVRALLAHISVLEAELQEARERAEQVARQILRYVKVPPNSQSLEVITGYIAAALSTPQPTLQQAIQQSIFAELNRRYELHKATHSGEWNEAKHQETFQFWANAVFNCWPKIVAALSSLAGTQPDGWLPIESVPRDGSEVFIVFPDGHVQIWKTRLPDDKSFWYEHAPTHWLSMTVLPSPPKEQQ